MKFKFDFICILSSVFGFLVPNISNYNGLSVWYIIYVIFLLIFRISAIMYLLMHKINYVYKTSLITVTIIDFTLYLLLSLIDLYSSLSAIFLNRRKLVTFFRQLKEFDEIFEWKFGIHSNAKSKSPQIVFFITSTVVIGNFVYTFINRNNIMKSENIFQCGLQFLLFYSLCLIVVQIYHFIKSLEKRFQILNMKLFYFVTDFKVFQKYKKSLPSGMIQKILLNVTDLCKIHDNLCDLIDLLNYTFGFQMLVIFTITIDTFLCNLNYLFKFAFRIYIVEENVFVHIGIYNFYTLITFIVSIIFQLFNLFTTY